MPVVCVCVYVVSGCVGGRWRHLRHGVCAYEGALGGTLWQTVGTTDDVCCVSFGAAVAVHVHRWPCWCRRLDRLALLLLLLLLSKRCLGAARSDSTSTFGRFSSLFSWLHVACGGGAHRWSGRGPARQAGTGQVCQGHIPLCIACSLCSCCGWGCAACCGVSKQVLEKGP